ncbi:alpha-hydroxy acid oxidase [Ilumatobacter sp.]|uniref:alpha-hydroxy acid oxidase n=1 Tax=Ilumatobacter sp. TaxID=1967498 RepID=UPI003AF7FB48
MTDRQLPTPTDFTEMLKFKKPTLDRTGARLAGAQTIGDLRRIAKRVTPTAPFDYTDGSAEAELSLARARQAFEDVEFQPAILRDVSDVDTSVTVTGGPSSLPFGIAPTGFTRMMHSAGEKAGAAAAGAAGIPFSLSTVGTATPEEVAAANPNGRNFFQLYMWRDRERSIDVLDRAAAAGFDTLLATVDVPVAGARLRDRYNGLTVPPTLTARTVLNAIPKVRWWFDFLTTEPMGFSTFKEFDGTVAELLDSMFDPTVTYDDLAWIKDRWPGPVVVKGVQTLDDAKRCADLGVDAVMLSNHGGRQLDRAPIPFHLLPAVRQELPGDVEVWVDTGIMAGADVVASIASGASFTMVGRAYLYGLMAGGRRGVDRAIEILSDEIVRTMKLLGVRSIGELEAGHVTQLRRLVPKEA